MLRDANGEERKGIEVLDGLLLKLLGPHNLRRVNWRRVPSGREISQIVFALRFQSPEGLFQFKETLDRADTIRDLMLAGF